MSEIPVSYSSFGLVGYHQRVENISRDLKCFIRYHNDIYFQIMSYVSHYPISHDFIYLQISNCINPCGWLRDHIINVSNGHNTGISYAYNLKGIPCFLRNAFWDHFLIARLRNDLSIMEKKLNSLSIDFSIYMDCTLYRYRLDFKFYSKTYKSCIQIFSLLYRTEVLKLFRQSPLFSAYSATHCPLKGTAKFHLVRCYQLARVI